MKTKKILLINFGGLGDQILFFTAIKAVKTEFPDSHVTFVTEPRSSSAEKLTDLIDESIICDIKSGNKYKNIFNLLSQILTKNFDVVISSGGSVQVSILLFLTGIKTKIGYDSGTLSRILLTKAVPLKKQQYAANMYYDLAKAVTSQVVTEIPEISVPDNAINKYRGTIKNTDKLVVVIHPGVSKLSVQKNILKFWDVKKWTELTKRLLGTERYRVVLTGGPDDREVTSAIRHELGEFLSEDLIDLTEKTANVMELAAIIQLADALVCVDSAPMHIGVGVKTRTIALFGPTDEYKLFPVHNSKFTAVTVENLECRPCLWDKRQVSCENPVCLDIPVDKVFKTVVN